MVFILFLINFCFSIFVAVFLSQKIKNLSVKEELFKEINKEVSEILTEINASTERNVSILEDKIEKMNRILSDGKIILDGIEKSKLPKNNKSSFVNDDSAFIVQRSPDSYKKSDLPKKQQEIVESIPAAETDFRSEVIKLYKEGFSNYIIAKKMNIPLIEVDFITSTKNN